MNKPPYYIVNAITLYRLLAAFALLFVIYIHEIAIFKWLLAFSFFTDLVDGYIARRYKVVSVMGARLDSIADDLTFLMAAIAVFVLKPEFIHREIIFIILLLGMYLIQTVSALIRYGKMTSFHTYTAKLAAILQGSFLILLFFLPQYPRLLFYLAAGFTMLDLIEETVLVLLLPQWKADVKGVFWLKKRE